MVGIYRIISPTNRIYIGQSVNIEDRIYKYRYLYCLIGQIRLYKSFVKYGYENHIFEVVEECEELELNDKERYYQDLYNVLDNKKGLNCRLTKADDKSGRLSEETKLKQSLTRKRLFKEGIIVNPNLKGEKRDPVLMLSINIRKRKPVLQYDLEMNFIKEWEGVVLATNYYSLSKNCIINCLKKGLNSSSGGFKWKYKNE